MMKVRERLAYAGVHNFHTYPDIRLSKKISVAGTLAMAQATILALKTDSNWHYHYTYYETQLHSSSIQQHTHTSKFLIKCFSKMENKYIYENLIKRIYTWCFRLV